MDEENLSENESLATLPFPKTSLQADVESPLQRRTHPPLANNPPVKIM